MELPCGAAFLYLNGPLQQIRQGMQQQETRLLELHEKISYVASQGFDIAANELQSTMSLHQDSGFKGPDPRKHPKKIPHDFASSANKSDFVAPSPRNSAHVPSVQEDPPPPPPAPSHVPPGKALRLTRPLGPANFPVGNSFRENYFPMRR